MSHPPYSEISSRKRDVHFSEAPLNLVLSGLVLAWRLRRLTPACGVSICARDHLGHTLVTPYV